MSWFLVVLRHWSYDCLLLHNDMPLLFCFSLVIMDHGKQLLSTWMFDYLHHNKMESMQGRNLTFYYHGEFIFWNLKCEYMRFTIFLKWTLFLGQHMGLKEAEELRRDKSGKCSHRCSLPLDIDRNLGVERSEDKATDNFMEKLILLTSNTRSWRAYDDETVDLTEPRFESFSIANARPLWHPKKWKRTEDGWSNRFVCDALQ